MSALDRLRAAHRRFWCWHLCAELRIEPLTKKFLSYRCPDCGADLPDPRHDHELAA